MNLLSWILFGLLAGWVASLVAPGRGPRGCLSKTATGVVGALLGGAVYRLATGEAWSFEFDLPSFGVAVLGAVALILIVGLATKR